MLGVLATLGVGAWLWALDRGPANVSPDPDGPAWARLRDHLLEGPDAGAWASNAAAIWLGRPDELDPHRLPILPYLTAFAMRAVPDPALAGHLVNHLLHLALGPVLYLLGRRWMGRGMALGAALVAITWPDTVMSAERYGVDPLVAVAVPASLLAAEGAARRWALSPLFGMIVGLAATCHLTTIGMPVPALMLALFRGAPGWRRWLGALGLLAGALLGVGLAYSRYPTLPADLLLKGLAEGVEKTTVTVGPPDIEGMVRRAIDIVTQGGPAALERVVGFLAKGMRTSFLPWAALLFLPWLGILGFGLGEPRPPARGRLAAVLRPLRGLGVGVPLAAALVPLLAFAAAGSPPRYSANFFPLGMLLMFRGLASVLALADAGLARLLPRWPVGLLGLAVGVAVAVGRWDPSRTVEQLRRPPTGLELADWRLGALLREHFEPGGGAACLRREVVAYAGRVYCPASMGLEHARAKEPVRAHLDAECGGEGPVPYVILEGIADGASAARLRMDAWVEEHGTLIARFEDTPYRARVYAVDRPAE